MAFLLTVLKILVMLGLVLLIAAPFLAEYLEFRADKKKGITHKRLRLMVYSVLYAILITVALRLLGDLLRWIGNLGFVQWIVTQLGVSARTDYFTWVLSVILVNFAVGLLYRLIGRLVRTGMAKSDLTKPKKKDGTFSLLQRAERRILRFFNKEIWFFVGKVLTVFAAAVSAVYALFFLFIQIPAVFSAGWIPFSFLERYLSAGYVYPTVTMLTVWEACCFLKGVSLISEECPELLKEDGEEEKKDGGIDLKALDEKIKKEFGGFYACELDLSGIPEEAVTGNEHQVLSEMIAGAVENDRRIPHTVRQTYLTALDSLVRDNGNVLINGSFFSEFSAYYFRYLSMVLARGDNVILLCNSDAQIETVATYLTGALSELTSLYCRDFAEGGVDLDHPIWKIVSAKNVPSPAEAQINEASVLITTPEYLCSSRFETEHGAFVALLDSVIVVDTVRTVNEHRDAFAALNVRLKQLFRLNARLAKSSASNPGFKARFMDRGVRYVCFDDTRIPGLDGILVNLLDVPFSSADIMCYRPKTLVRCYRYEGKPDENGRYSCPQCLNSEEEIGAIVNVAVYCLQSGAGRVNVFTDGIPYGNIMETVDANGGNLTLKVDRENLRLNLPSVDPSEYTVILAMDSGDNLPESVRRYAAMAASDAPSLVIVFSRPSLLRGFYEDHLAALWKSTQMSRIPSAGRIGTNVGRIILAKANAGGISEEEVRSFASSDAGYAKILKEGGVDAVLKEVIRELSGPSGSVDPEHYFEYTTTRDFNEAGVFVTENRISLRKKGQLYDLISGQDRVVMVTGEHGIPLPLPRGRLTQNYIAGQNLLYEGEIYFIEKTDPENGTIYTKHVTGGKNDETYRYLQSRFYRVETAADKIEFLYGERHVELVGRKKDDVSVSEIFVAAFRAPTEVLTSGYYDADPHTLLAQSCQSAFHRIDDEDNDLAARQTYRRYGALEAPIRSDEWAVSGKASLFPKGATMMSVRLEGSFGPDKDRTACAAAFLLNEILHTMFPSASDAVSVCPILSSEPEGDDAAVILRMIPRIALAGTSRVFRGTGLELMIVEDSPEEIGVISVLMSAGDDLMNTLFSPIFSYLKWRASRGSGDTFLRCGLDHDPDCFDLASLGKLSSLLGDDEHDLRFIDTDALIEYEECDFCGRRAVKPNGMTELPDGRRMCKECASHLVGNNRRDLKILLDRAKLFMESTYGIRLNDEYEFCFESTLQIIGDLKKSKSLSVRGADSAFHSYVDDKKRVHIEYSLPAVNLSELLARELTHVWQLNHLPQLPEDLAEGHIALIGIQYLRYLGQDTTARHRTKYYESARTPSGVGYRTLVRALIENPQYRNNPFRYLLEHHGEGEHTGTEEVIPPTKPTPITESEFGKPYQPEHPDRVPGGTPPFFWRSRLTATLQTAYDRLLEGIRKFEPEIPLNVSGAEIMKVFEAVDYDHPELFYQAERGRRMSNGKAYPNYVVTPEEAERLQKRIDEAAAPFLKDISDSMSAYDVTLRLHVRMIAAVDYDTIALNREKKRGGPSADKIDTLRTICGVFLDGKAVCEGYARAMQYLLQKCGVESAEVGGMARTESGSRGGHAWNIVKVDGDYYYLDTTWDDSSSTVQEVKVLTPGFSFFLITSEELSRTRDTSMCPADLPPCTATRANYYFHNGFVMDRFDTAKLKEIGRAAGKSGSPVLTFKCLNAQAYQDAMSRIQGNASEIYDALKAAADENKKIDAKRYTYTSDKRLRTVSITFVMK